MVNRIPVVNWFKDDPQDPRLIGKQCKNCGTYYFPAVKFCRNPKCMSDELVDVELSNKGKLWSHSTNFYQPPEPFVAEPFLDSEGNFKGYTVCIVTLEKEQMSIAGQLASGYTHEQIKTGMDMELVIEPLWTDEEGEHTEWKWKPVL